MKKRKTSLDQMEQGINQMSKMHLREAMRDVAQSRADACPPVCPVCGTGLQDTRIEERTVRSQWGEITLKRTYGYCPKCLRWLAPADTEFGLKDRDTNTPVWAEMMSCLGTKVPMSEAAENLEHITGEKVAPSRVERETKRTAEKALAVREEDVEQALSPTEHHEFARNYAQPPAG